jgi:hypothetical protein
MTEEIKFDLGTPAETPAETPVETQDVTPAEAPAPASEEELYGRMLKFFEQREDSKVKEKTAREQENERFANQRRLEDKAAEIGITRAELEERQEVVAKITKKDKLDAYEETRILLELDSRERAKVAERAAHKQKIIEDDNLLAFGTRGVEWTLPRITEIVDKAANFPLMKTLENTLSTEQMRELTMKFVQNYTPPESHGKKEVEPAKKSIEDLWNIDVR